MGLPPERLKQLPGYDPDVGKSRAAARSIMQRLGYGPDNPLAVKVATRNIPLYRDPAVMLIDQLKEIYIAGELDIVETANWNPKVTRRDYMVGLENTGTAVVDDPDQPLYESYACDSDRNFTGYCNRELETAFRRQSAEPDREKRQQLVWEIDSRLQEEGARPVIFHMRGATCWHSGQGADDDGQQHLQRLAARRRLAREIIPSIPIERGATAKKSRPGRGFPLYTRPNV